MPHKILIIEDDRDSLKLTDAILQKAGYSILAATKGKKGLKLAKTEKPDLIVLDVMLPDLSGWEIARRLRNSPTTKSIPIVMFSAKSQVDDKVEGLKSGADAYVLSLK